jgi:hypothetical protein
MDHSAPIADFHNHALSDSVTTGVSRGRPTEVALIAPALASTSTLPAPPISGPIWAV